MHIMHDAVLTEFRLCHKAAVLQVDQVLFIVAVVGEFRIGAHGKGARLIGCICDLDIPDFMACLIRHVIDGFRCDAGIVRAHFCIALTMTDFRMIVLQVLSDRLPGSGPVIPGIIVPEIDIAARLIGIRKQIPQDAALCAGAHKAVAARIGGNQRTVFRRAEIVGPGRRGIRTRDDIFPRFIVKITVLHDFPLFCFSVVILLCFDCSGSAGLPETFTIFIAEHPVRYG